MARQCAGCTIYSPEQDLLVCGLKSNKLEGFGGDSKPGETSFQTAIREMLEEMTNTYEVDFQNWEAEIPLPKYTLVGQGGYVNYVYTYQDYQILSQILGNHGVVIPATIEEVLLQQLGREHDLITQIPINPLVVPRDLVRDYFYADMQMLELVRFQGYETLRVTMTKDAESVEFGFVADGRHFSLRMEPGDDGQFIVTDSVCQSPRDDRFAREYALLAL
jgi:hypothetical protein